MRLKKRERFTVIGLFVFVFLFVAVVIFAVLYASGIIVINNSRQLSISSFSCTASGVYLSVQKNGVQTVNLTSLEIYNGGYLLADIPLDYLLKTESALIHTDNFRCLVSGNYSIRLYYSSYSSFMYPSVNTDNFFLGLISNTKN